MYGAESSSADELGRLESLPARAFALAEAAPVVELFPVINFWALTFMTLSLSNLPKKYIKMTTIEVKMNIMSAMMMRYIAVLPPSFSPSAVAFDYFESFSDELSLLSSD